MARITVEDCIDKFPSRFELVLVSSQRAKKLHSGDEPLVEKDNDKNTVIALREIAESSLTVEEMKENLIQEYQTITISDEEDENLEIESRENDENIDIKKSNENSTNLDLNIESQVEEEMNDLVASVDDEIDQQYKVTDTPVSEELFETNTPVIEELVEGNDDDVSSQNDENQDNKEVLE